MNQANTLKEAMDFFLKNSSGTVTCKYQDKQKQCDSYPKAIEFFNNARA